MSGIQRDKKEQTRKQEKSKLSVGWRRWMWFMTSVQPDICEDIYLQV